MRLPPHSVPFMRKLTPTSFYRKFDGFKVLQIPFAKKGLDLIRFSMYFILPKEKDGLSLIVEKLNAGYGLFNQCFELPEKILLELAVPKFKIRCEFSASDTMKELGLTMPFMPVEELTGIVDNGDGIYVSETIQNCYINVDEKGTEAVAVLSLPGGGSSEGMSSFIADSPLLFMVREDTSSAVLFMGTVLNPAPVE